MKTINNQLFRLISFFCIFQLIGLGCQNNSPKSTSKDRKTENNALFSKKLNGDTIALNDIWLVKDADLEKGEVIRAYKISHVSIDSIKYVKSKVIFDTTIADWQAGLTKQMNFDVNINYRVNKNVKEKWLASKKIIAILYR